MKNIDELMEEGLPEEPGMKSYDLPVPVGDKCLLERADHQGQFWGIVLGYGQLHSAYNFKPDRMPTTHAIVMVPHVRNPLAEPAVAPMGTDQASSCVYIIEVDEVKAYER